MNVLNRITANEARSQTEAAWSFPLNKIYDGVRDATLKCETCYTFDLGACADEVVERVLRELENDGYRIVRCAWNSKHYTIFW